MGDPKMDASLKEFKAPQDMAGIYIYRNETFGAEYILDVLVDGLEIGSTASETYLYKEVVPGRHTVTSKGENRDSVEIDAKPDKLVFIWQEAKFGMANLRTKVHLVSEQEGKRGVQETRLAIQ